MFALGRMELSGHLETGYGRKCEPVGETASNQTKQNFAKRVTHKPITANILITNFAKLLFDVGVVYLFAKSCL